MSSPRRRALRLAFQKSLPILAGFSFLGIAYGVFMHSSGLSVWWTLLMSSTIFAGSMEFVTVSLLSAAFEPLYAFLLTLMVNARHLFYGLSMLDRFRGTGSRKPYLIFGMCDETFSILCSTEVPEDVDRNDFFLFVTLLNQLYWVGGAVVGNLAGSLIPFDTRGIDFVMTALFVVIFLEQWETYKNHTPALVGLGASALCLLLFGQSSFLLPSMLLIALALLLLRRPMERKGALK